MRNRFIQTKANKFQLLIIAFLLFSMEGFSQKIDLQSDLMLADSVKTAQNSMIGKRDYIFKNEPKTFKNSNPVSLIYGGTLFVYQNILSQHFSASCLIQSQLLRF